MCEIDYGSLIICMGYIWEIGCNEDCLFILIFCKEIFSKNSKSGKGTCWDELGPSRLLSCGCDEVVDFYRAKCYIAKIIYL